MMDLSRIVGNARLAGLDPPGGRAERWSVTYQAAEPVLANREPQIESVAHQPDRSETLTFANPQSKTLRIHGDGVRRVGNTAYAAAPVRVDDGLLNPAKPLASTAPRHYLGAEAKEWPGATMSLTTRNRRTIIAGPSSLRARAPNSSRRSGTERIQLFPYKWHEETPMGAQTCRRGFTLVEIAVVVVVVFLGLVCAVAWIGGSLVADSRKRGDMARLRSIVSAIDSWASSNAGLYPLPSLMDTRNATVPEIGPAKDTTANIFSMLIFSSFFPPEYLVSEAEVNSSITVDETHSLDDPPTALDPSHAQWDPSFRADFSRGGAGNVSFAHTIPLVNPASAGPPRWGQPAIPGRAVVSNRGPDVMSVTPATVGEPTPVFSAAPGGGRSNTFRIHGGSRTWEGVVAYGDGSVTFETSVAPPGLNYAAAHGRLLRDVLFFDEPDDAAGSNNYLGIFTTAGAAAKDFTAIAD
jgi:type II secretory pathway pseudopilin PulG